MKYFFVFFCLISLMSRVSYAGWAGDRIIKNLYVFNDNSILIEIENELGMKVCTHTDGQVVAQLKLTSDTIGIENMYAALLASKAANMKISVNYNDAVIEGSCSLDQLSKTTQVSL